MKFRYCNFIRVLICLPGAFRSAFPIAAALSVQPCPIRRSGSGIRDNAAERMQQYKYAACRIERMEGSPGGAAKFASAGGHAGSRS
jgi:hypothetical protein